MSEIKYSSIDPGAFFGVLRTSRELTLRECAELQDPRTWVELMGDWVATKDRLHVRFRPDVSVTRRSLHQLHLTITRLKTIGVHLQGALLFENENKHMQGFNAKHCSYGSVMVTPDAMHVVHTPAANTVAMDESYINAMAVREWRQSE